MLKKNLKTIIIFVVLGLIIISPFFVHIEIIKEETKECKQSKVVKVESVGVWKTVKYTCFLEDGSYGICDEDIKIGDMACLVGNMAIKKEEYLNY